MASFVKVQGCRTELYHHYELMRNSLLNSTSARPIAERIY